MALNWTTILAGTIPSVINALAIFLCTRYASRVLTRLESKVNNGKNNNKGS